ncbi:YfiR family protein [Desulfomarina sp.]
MIADCCRAKKFFIIFLQTVLLLFADTTTSVNARSTKIPEYYIKAGFLANFARLVDWPRDHLENSTTLFLCVMDPTVFGESLNTIDGKIIHGRRLSVSTCSRKTDFNRLHILFFNSPDRTSRKNLIARCREKPILTIGETPGFARHEGMINFYKDKKRIRFEINRQRAEKAGLKISSRLLKLAKIVSDSPNRSK